jgi:hypothetical protein
VFRQNFCEGRQKRTAYFASVGPGTPVLVPGFQWGDYSNSGIHLRYVNYGVQYSGFTRAFHWCVTVVAEVAASSSKYARSGRKFKKDVYFGWFLCFFPKYHIGPVGPVQKETQTPDRK